MTLGEMFSREHKLGQALHHVPGRSDDGFHLYVYGVYQELGDQFRVAVRFLTFKLRYLRANIPA